MMSTLIICALLVLLAGAASVAGAKWISVKHLQADNQRLRQEHEQLAQQASVSLEKIQQIEEENHQLKTQLQLAQQEIVQKQQAFAEAQQQSENTFKALANDTLKQASNQFLQLATKSLESEKKDAAAELEKRKQAIESLLKPIREQLQQHAKAVQEVEKDRQGAYQKLHQQVASLMEAQQILSTHTTNLTTALRGSATIRGTWGELTLKRIVELAGMSAYCDFQEQVSVETDGGHRIRPDMIVTLPSERTIVIDAKAVGQNYLEAVHADNEDQREKLLKQHANDMMSRVKALAGKDYVSQFEHAPDFVVLFVPADSFLQAALAYNHNLLDHAMQQNVVIATPSTLICLLKAVAIGWREQQITQNAQKISDMGQKLYERLVTMVDHIQAVGTALGRSVTAYDKLVGTLQTRVLTSAKKFEEMGIKSKKAKVLEATWDPPAGLHQPREMPRVTETTQKA